jgi:RimJ/RimL family protein N-acetyltransferase
MFVELQPAEFSRVLPLMQSIRHGVPPKAVIAGNCPGRIFADDAEHPAAAFVWTRFGYFYLVGDAGRVDFIHALRDLLRDTLIPDSVRLGERGFILYPFEEAWGAQVRTLLEGRAPFKIFRRTFDFHPDRFAALPDWRARIPDGFTLRRIDADLIAQVGGVPFPVDVFWNSMEDFLARGFGFCLLRGSEVVSTCFAPFVVDGMAEVDIHTAEAYRGRGFAALTASAFVEHTLAGGLRPNWECFWDNTPSYRLAEKLGFETTTTTRFSTGRSRDRERGRADPNHSRIGFPTSVCFRNR